MLNQATKYSHITQKQNKTNKQKNYIINQSKGCYKCGTKNI